MAGVGGKFIPNKNSGYAPPRKMGQQFGNRDRLNSQSSVNSSGSASGNIQSKFKQPEKPESIIERNRKTRVYDINRLFWRIGIECPESVKEGLWDIGAVQAQKLFEHCSMSLNDPEEDKEELSKDLEETLAAKSTTLTRKFN